jgi:hypothetical protein
MNRQRLPNWRASIDPHLELVRQLMRDDLSLEQAWCLLNAAAQLDRAASATVESLMHSLRERRTVALTERDTQRRISELSEQQLHEVCGRLQKLTIAQPWTTDQLKPLVEAWKALHHA